MDPWQFERERELRKLRSKRYRGGLPVTPPRNRGPVEKIVVDPHDDPQKGGREKYAYPGDNDSIDMMGDCDAFFREYGFTLTDVPRPELGGMVTHIGHRDDPDFDFVCLDMSEISQFAARMYDAILANQSDEVDFKALADGFRGDGWPSLPSEKSQVELAWEEGLAERRSHDAASDELQGPAIEEAAREVEEEAALDLMGEPEPGEEEFGPLEASAPSADELAAMAEGSPSDADGDAGIANGGIAVESAATNATSAVGTELGAASGTSSPADSGGSDSSTEASIESDFGSAPDGFDGFGSESDASEGDGSASEGGAGDGGASDGGASEGGGSDGGASDGMD